MAEQMRPSSPQNAPDPAHSYERADPDREAGMGQLDNNDRATPTSSPDRPEQAVTNRQPGERQVNAHDVVNRRGEAAPEQPDHSMKDEEPDGWDQAPTDIQYPRRQRHPRHEGKGGTP
jgi:hypothetical protein